MKRFLKPILVAVSLATALFLTVQRRGTDSGIDIRAHKALNAAPGRQSDDYDLTALKVFNVALVRVKDNYVKPQLIKPKQMLVAALDAVEKSVAEVLVEEDLKKSTINIKVDSFQQQFDMSGVDSPWALSSRIKGILRFIQAHLLKGTNIRDVEYAAINGMLSTLDPHSILLKPETYDEMKLSTRGEFGGLGIVISMVKGVLTVMNPMKETPAETAGIKACDQILKIGEESTVNMTLNQAVNRLRGAPGSTIDITLLRQGWTKPVRKTLTRAIIKVPAVRSRLLAKKVGYISLNSFQSNSLSDIQEQLKQLKRKGMRGLVLDMRGNPGGLLDQAIKISDLFIDSGTLVTTVSFGGKRREEKRATAEGTEPRYPIAVLVDSGSASASEIVAGALQNLDRAVIIGKRTFGKGSVQVLYDNDDGSALKLTIAEYLTPGDVSIQAVGITPDVSTTPVYVQKDFISLERDDDSRREKDLSQHLIHTAPTPTGKSLTTLFYLAEEEDADKEQEAEQEQEANLCLYPDRSCKPADEDKFVEDFQIKTARDLVARTKFWRRSQILSSSTDFFAKQLAAEEARISEALKKIGVDWTRVPATAKPRLRVSVTTDPRRGKAMACSKMKITVTVRNDGEAPTSRLKAVSKSSNDIFDGHELAFGSISPGTSRSWTVPISIRDAPTRIDDVTFTFDEANGNAPPPFTLPIGIEGMQRPVFAYGYQLIDDIQANQDGRAQRGEKVRLFVKVKNTGKGTSFRTITTLKNLSGVGIFIRKGRYILGKLAQGESTTASFTLDIQNSYAMPTFKVELTVYDDALREFVSRKLELKIAQSADAPKQAGGAVRINSASAVFREAPSDTADEVGFAGRGAAFMVDGTSPGWYRVKVAPDRTAFIAARDVTPGGAPTPDRFRSRWQVTPPTLQIQVPTYATASKTIRIQGNAVDHREVKDLFIFVRNADAKISARKVFYLSNTRSGHPRSLSFAADVPLWAGANYVSVHVRENEDVQSQETVVIFRKDKIELAGGAKPELKKPAVR